MENSYGIGVANRYELFYDEDVDPMDLIAQADKLKLETEKENTTKGGVKTVKGPAGKKAGKTEVNNKIAEKTEPFSNAAGRGRGGDNRVKFSDREERNNRRNRPEGEFRQPGEFKQGGDFKTGGEFRDGERPAPRFDGDRGRGRGRGGDRGRGRGRGRGAGPDGRGNREFDRRSGDIKTGVKSVDKREGSGSYNWGSDKELVEENLNAEVSDHDTSAENAEKIEEGAAPTEGEDKEKTEEEQAREMTLDEYKAMQKAAKAAKTTAFNIRKAGEGENQAQWKKTYVLKKKVEEEADEDEEEDEESHHGRRKVVLDIDFQFSDSPARGRGRGRGRGGDRGRGRGGDRGGFERRGGGMGGGRGEGRGMDAGEQRGRGGRGGPRGGRGGQQAPKMDDERDFPSLG